MRSKSSFDKLLIEIINRKNNARQAKLMPTPASHVCPASKHRFHKPSQTTLIDGNGQIIPESMEQTDELLQKKSYLDFLRLH